jgi:glycine cleavage system H protein
MSNVPAGLRYTKEHEWAKFANGEATIGITAFAVEQLGDVTLVNLDVKVGDAVSKGKAFGTIESVKTLSDLFSPVDGKIVKVNTALTDKPELVNESCYEGAWMVVIATADTGAELMDEKGYEEFLKSTAH